MLFVHFMAAIEMSKSDTILTSLSVIVGVTVIIGGIFGQWINNDDVIKRTGVMCVMIGLLLIASVSMITFLLIGEFDFRSISMS